MGLNIYESDSRATQAEFASALFTPDPMRANVFPSECRELVNEHLDNQLAMLAIIEHFEKVREDEDWDPALAALCDTDVLGNLIEEAIRFCSGNVDTESVRAVTALNSMYFTTTVWLMDEYDKKVDEMCGLMYQRHAVVKDLEVETSEIETLEQVAQEKKQIAEYSSAASTLGEMILKERDKLKLAIQAQAFVSHLQGKN